MCVVDLLSQYYLTNLYKITPKVHSQMIEQQKVPVGRLGGHKQCSQIQTQKTKADAEKRKIASTETKKVQQN